jgi:hypothetical protein
MGFIFQLYLYRILKCGGAIVAGSVILNLTHVFLDEKELTTNRSLNKKIKELRDVGVACVTPVYLGDYLTNVR